MGCFSWCTSDTRKSIPCVDDAYEGAPSTVYLLNPFGEPYKETAYECYGEFGGHDVYDLVAEWNRKFLSPANLRKPDRNDFEAGKEGTAYFKTAMARYEGACKGIEAFARGATDEEMQNNYAQFFSYMNGSDWKRCLGIAIACHDEEHVKLRYPIKIVEEPCDYNEADISPGCPFQGFGYEYYSLEGINDRVDREFEKLQSAIDNHMAEKIDTLCDFFWKSHMEDIVVIEDAPGHLIIRDEDEQEWEEGEIYDFVLNECLGFEPDGKLQFGFGAISQELADALKAHAAEYGVFAQGLEPSVEDKLLEADEKFNFETADGAVGRLVDVTNEDWYKNPSMNLYDELEYDCWELVCKYAELIGLHLEKEEIDFHLTKTVQESIMNLLEKEVGVEFPVYGKEVAKNTLADKIARAEEKGRASTSDKAEFGIENLEDR